jgi:sugar/nucleoside kinase (ribokinase family)
MIKSGSTQVFVYGETGADNIIQVPYLPTPERAACILSDTYHVGGVGANVAVFLSAWGVAVRLSGNALGDDDYGRIARTGLEACANLDLTHLETHPGVRTPFWRIMVTPDGERTQLYGFGDLSMTPLRPEMLGGARFLSLDLYGGAEREEAARLAHKAGLTVVIGDITQPEHPLLPITDIAANSASLTRGEYPSEDPFEHAMRLHEVSRGIILTTDGPDPAQVIDRDGQQFWVKPPRVEVVDATGAGDAFKAGVIYGLLRGWGLEKAVVWGVAAGSLNTRYVGATSHPPEMEGVENLARQITVSKNR